MGLAYEGSGNAECEKAGSSVELKGARDGISSRKGGEEVCLGDSAGSARSAGREGAVCPFVSRFLLVEVLLSLPLRLALLTAPPLLLLFVVVPVIFLPFSTARWYLDRATESCSFVSISVSMVSSSGGGLSTAMYP